MLPCARAHAANTCCICWVCVCVIFIWGARTLIFTMPLLLIPGKYSINKSLFKYIFRLSLIKDRIKMASLRSNCLLIAMLLCCCVPLLVNGNAAKSSTISSDKVLQFRDANYTVWTSGNVSYISSTSYSAKGMAPLYKIANEVLRHFIGDVVIPDGKFIIATACALNFYFF